MRTLRIISAVLMVLVLAFSLNDSHNAAHDAKHAVTEVRALVHRLAVQDYQRAVAACGSSTSLRRLLDDLDDIIVSASTDKANQALVQFDRRIHAYTDKNPNCEHVPPKPDGVGGTK